MVYKFEKIKMKKIKISAVIACYRDEKAIPIMHKRLVDTFKKIGVNYEIIFVNDGSPDDTEVVLKRLVKKDRHVTAINHSRNFNSQMAFTSGIDVATGDGVVLLDGDLQDPPEIIEKFYKKWVAGYDVVYGVRTRREAPLLMQILYKLYYRIFHKLSYITMPLDAGDFSLMDRKVIDNIKQFTERDRFLRGLRAWVGFKQIGVPYYRPERMFGKTTNNLFRNLDWASRGIFSFSYIPLRMMSYLSLFTFTISILAIIAEIVFHLLNPSLPFGATAIVVIILFVGSIQLLGIGILGEYIGRIFEEVKRRPKYIVKSTFTAKR